MHRITLPLALLSALLLTACGQTGGLYLPGTQSPYGPPHYPPRHPQHESTATMPAAEPNLP